MLEIKSQHMTWIGPKSLFAKCVFRIIVMWFKLSISSSLANYKGLLGNSPMQFSLSLSEKSNLGCISFTKPNSGKILLYWLLRSKIWYFRVIWLFTANFFAKMVFFDALWRAAVKNQNKTIQLDFCQIRLY